jgi:hypothetical protein
MPGADSYPEGTQALTTDHEQRSLVKIVQLLNDGGGGGGTTQIATGTSDPSGAPAAGIVLFQRTDRPRLLSWNGASWDVLASD